MTNLKDPVHVVIALRLLLTSYSLVLSLDVYIDDTWLVSEKEKQVELCLLRERA